MTTFGTVGADCPVCGAELHIPVTCSGPTIGIAATIASLTVTLAADADYLLRHWANHPRGGGEPLPMAA